MCVNENNRKGLKSQPLDGDSLLFTKAEARKENILETLKSSVLTVCLLSIAVSVCLFLCPEHALRRQTRFLVSLLFLLSLLPALPSPDFSGIPESVQQSQADQTAMILTEQSVKQTLISILEKKGILCKEISVSLHMDENRCISITDVSVTCDNFQQTLRTLREVLGEGVKLHVSETLESVQS